MERSKNVDCNILNLFLNINYYVNAISKLHHIGDWQLIIIMRTYKKLNKTISFKYILFTIYNSLWLDKHSIGMNW